MNLLWAPWRMDYILGPKPDTCIFCLPPEDAGEDAKRLVLKRGRHAFVVMNKYPYNNGHLMVVPYLHTSDFTSLNAETCMECMDLIQLCVKALNRFAAPDGVNLGMNLGRAAGAGVGEHLHWHVVARFDWDSHFPAPLWATAQRPSPAAQQAGVSARLPVLEAALQSKLGQLA